MEISAASLVTVFDAFREPTASSSDPSWTAAAVNAFVSQRQAQSRLAEAIGHKDVADRVAAANADALTQFTECCLAVPFGGFPIVVVVVIHPPPPPPLREGLSGRELLEIGGQLLRAGDEYETDATRLLEAGISRLAAKYK